MGLLSSMLGGAAKAGVASAQRVGAENVAWDREQSRIKLNGDREKTLANIKIASQEKIAANRLAHDATQGGLDRDNRLTTSRISAANKTPKTDTLKANYSDDGVFLGSYDPNRDVYNESSNSPKNKQNAMVLQLKADKYADGVVSDMAGYGTSDSEDFKEFGGSVTKARDFHRREFLKNNSPGKFSNLPGDSSQSATQLPTLEQIMLKNPNVTQERAVRFLNSLKKPKRSWINALR